MPATTMRWTHVAREDFELDATDPFRLRLIRDMSLNPKGDPTMAVVPDTMHEVSNSFPEVYRALPTTHLLEAFEAAPLRIRMAIQGLSIAELSEHPIAGKWSVAQIVCHLADADIVGAFRFRLALAQPGATAPTYDQNAWSDRLRDPTAVANSVEHAVSLFAGLRADVHELIRDLPEDGFARSIIHPEWGVVTVRQLLELYADHGERHLAQILERRRLLGHPLELPLLLPDRLY